MDTQPEREIMIKLIKKETSTRIELSERQAEAITFDKYCLLTAKQENNHISIQLDEGPIYVKVELSPGAAKKLAEKLLIWHNEVKNRVLSSNSKVDVKINYQFEDKPK